MGSIGSSGTASWRPCEARAKGYSWASFSSVRAGTGSVVPPRHGIGLCGEDRSRAAGGEGVRSFSRGICMFARPMVPDRLPRPPADPHAGGRRLGRCLVHGDGAGGRIFVGAPEALLEQLRRPIGLLEQRIQRCQALAECLSADVLRNLQKIGRSAACAGTGTSSRACATSAAAGWRSARAPKRIITWRRR